MFVSHSTQEEVTCLLQSLTSWLGKSSIRAFRMLDGELHDDKVLAVAATDPLFSEYRALKDIPPHFLREVSHFFEVYKDLEGVRVKPLGWEDEAVAKKEILRAQRLFMERLGWKVCR